MPPSRLDEHQRFQYLDPKVLASIAGIEMAARYLVEGLWASRHRSPLYGYSVEFIDHRNYTFGDELKTIDWRVFGRTDRYYVKRFEMESNMDVTILLDLSASMGYEPEDKGRLTKLQYSSYLAAGLAYLLLHQQDAPGLVTFDTEIRAFLPPRQSRRHLWSILAELDKAQCGGETGIGPVLETIGERLKRRGMVILISDCLDDADSLLGGIRRVAARQHEVLVFQVLDHDERNWPYQRPSSFIDLETDATVEGDPVALRQGYLNQLEEFLETIADGCRRSNVHHVLMETSSPLEKALRDYLLRRLALSK